MLPDKFSKILDLIRKTGDRLILLDPNHPEQAYALMSFEAYHDLIFKKNKDKDKEMITKENSELDSDSQSNQQRNKVEDSSSEQLTEEDITDKINREISSWKNRDESPYLGEQDQTKKAWEISPKVKSKAEEVV